MMTVIDIDDEVANTDAFFATIDGRVIDRGSRDHDAALALSKIDSTLHRSQGAAALAR
jgi:hypothetical protein